MDSLKLTVEFDREDDGRWIANVPELPGVSVYGATREEARRHVHALALHVLADRLDELAAARDTIERVKPDERAAVMKAKVYGEMAYKWRKRCIEAGIAADEDRILADEWQARDAELAAARAELAVERAAHHQSVSDRFRIVAENSKLTDALRAELEALREPFLADMEGFVIRGPK